MLIEAVFNYNMFIFGQVYCCIYFRIVVNNLYPFAKTIAKPDVFVPEAIEQIDIGTLVTFFQTLSIFKPCDVSDILDELNYDHLGTKLFVYLYICIYIYICQIALLNLCSLLQFVNFLSI